MGKTWRGRGGDERARFRADLRKSAARAAKSAGDELIGEADFSRGNWRKLVRDPREFTNREEPTVEDIISEGGCSSATGTS
jgi:hypothetical protein